MAKTRNLAEVIVFLSVGVQRSLSVERLWVWLTEGVPDWGGVLRGGVDISRGGLAKGQASGYYFTLGGRRDN
jgi:hypothetical protein